MSLAGGNSSDPAGEVSDRSTPISIAVDAMGGDHAPREVVRGAVEAVRLHPEMRLLLVGREPAVREELAAAGWTSAMGGSRIEVRHAEHVIDMGDSPVEALRRNFRRAGRL